MVAFYLGIIVGVLGGFLLLALLAEATRFFMAHKGEKNKGPAESLALAAADGYHGTTLRRKKSFFRQ